jgi:hypothetical protein
LEEDAVLNQHSDDTDDTDESSENIPHDGRDKEEVVVELFPPTPTPTPTPVDAADCTVAIILLCLPLSSRFKLCNN